MALATLEFQVNTSDSIMSPPYWWGVMGNVGVDILKISTLPFSPTDHHANDMRVVVLLKKITVSLPKQSYP